MIDNIFNGRMGDAIEDFGMTWREAYLDPSWWVLALSSLGGAALETAARGSAQEAAARVAAEGGSVDGAASRVELSVGKPAAPQPATPVKPNITIPPKVPPTEPQMIGMLSMDGAANSRFALMRNLRGKYVLRAEGIADTGAGDFFNGPYGSLEEAQAAAQRFSGSQSTLRQGNALPRTWPDGFQKAGGARSEVIRVYRIEYDVPGIRSVAAAQPESGTVMVRAEHLQAIRQGKPSIGFEYKGGNSQLELPVKGMQKTYGVNIVQRVTGAEYPVRMDGTGF
jgi:hypothetical protein